MAWLSDRVIEAKNQTAWLSDRMAWLSDAAKKPSDATKDSSHAVGNLTGNAAEARENTEQT